MMGEKIGKMALGCLAILWLVNIPEVLGADSSTTPVAVATTTTSVADTGSDQGKTETSGAMKAEFEKAYQELLETDPQAAESMKKEFEAFERGDLTHEDFDPEKAKEEFEKVYQEVLAKDPAEAAQMKEEYEKWSEWEKGGRVGEPPFEHDQDHNWEYGGGMEHQGTEPMSDTEKAEYEKSMQEHEGQEYERSGMEHESMEHEGMEREYERENQWQDLKYDNQPPQ